ncbi:hypothetical protein Tco_0181270, partial [Tanacetum coccineum]
HPSDTNVFTMKMEILLEPASNKLLHFQTLIMPDALIKLHCNVFSRGRVCGVICKLCSSNVDEEHSSSSLGRQCQMVSAENNTSGPVPQCS